MSFQKSVLQDRGYQKDFKILGISVEYKKGQLIFSPGDCTGNIYIIDSGYVRIYHIANDGTRVTLAIRYPGDIIGLIEPLFQTEVKYYVEAFRDVRLIKTSRQKILSKIEEDSEFALSLLQTLGVRLREAQEASCIKSTLPADLRLVMLLKELCHKCGVKHGDKVELSLKLTQEEMSSIIGTCRQTVSLISKYLKKKKALVRVDGIRLVDPKILTEIIESYAGM